MKGKIFILLGIFVFISYNVRLKKNYQIGASINKELLKCIEEYINNNEYKIALYYENGEPCYNIYYMLFFFNEDTSNYFTLWMSVIPLIPIEKDSFTDADFLYYNVLGRDIFIINNMVQKNNLLFSFCENNVLLGEKKQSIDINKVPIYDGSFYPRTYKYYNNDKDVIIEKVDTTLLYFVSGWTEYEKYQKYKQKHKYYNAPQNLDSNDK